MTDTKKITMRAYMHPHDSNICVIDRLVNGVVTGTWNVPWAQRPSYAQKVSWR